MIKQVIVSINNMLLVIKKCRNTGILEEKSGYDHNEKRVYLAVSMLTC